MNTRTIIHFFVAAVLVCTYGKSTAQQGSNPATWKKLVARNIDFPGKPGARHYKTTLLGLIADAQKHGKIRLFSNVDRAFSTPLPDADAAKLLSNKDAVSSVHKYRLLENWTFNPYTGKTEIQIEGIAPVREIFGADGSFRGVQAMFWVRYSDMQPILDRYQQYHPGNSLAGHIWSDYFSNDEKPTGLNSDWESNATRVIRIDDRPDTIIHHLVDNDDSSLFDVLMNLKLTGKVPSYPSAVHGFTIQMRKEELNDSELLNMIQAITDPVSGAEVIKSLPYLHNYDGQRYKILESWHFNPNTGKTEIEITGLAPAIEVTGNNDISPKIRPIFWVNYNDVRKAVSKYDQYHPGNSFALHVWNSYFLSDIKPEIER